jgi:hypothetical protein
MAPQQAVTAVTVTWDVSLQPDGCSHCTDYSSPPGFELFRPRRAGGCTIACSSCLRCVAHGLDLQARAARIDRDRTVAILRVTIVRPHATSRHGARRAGCRLAVRAAMRAIVFVVVLAACSESGSAAWPAPEGTVFSTCNATTGASCSQVGWCHSTDDCHALRGCYCNGTSYECFAADALCDFGESASCALEGNASCNTPPVGGSCSCTGGVTTCQRSCPLPECPSYDPGSETCR